MLDEEMFLGGERITRKAFENSSSLAFASYDKVANELEVTFKNGTRYRYFGVQQQLVTDLFEAQSVGKFFQAVIKKGSFKFERVT